MAIPRSLFEVVVKESNENRQFWLNQEWLQERKKQVENAEILAVPWINFREDQPALFPLGSDDVVNELRRFGGTVIDFAIDEINYREIMMHSDTYRLPKLFLKNIVLPALAGLLGNLMTEYLKAGAETDRVEVTLIIEGDHGKCISLDYKGPPTRLVETILSESNRCFPKSVSSNKEPIK